MNVDTPVKTGWFVLPGQKREKRLPAPGQSTISRRLPLINLLPARIRNHFIAMCGEFAGTFLFLFFALGGTQVVNTAPTNGQEALNADPAKLMYISLCFGMSLAVNAWVFFRISGGLFNPAVTLGMCLVGALPYIRGCLLIISQILGGIAAAAVVSALLPGPLNVRTSLGGGTSVVQGLFIEMFLTAQLVFTIFMLAAEKHKATFIAPVGIGLSLFVAELLGVYYTGGSVNPARTFGPCVVLHAFYPYHWIYWVGPILGSLLASGFYLFMKVLEYETVNPAQDADREEGEHFDPDKYQMENTAGTAMLGWNSGSRPATGTANMQNGSAGSPTPVLNIPEAGAGGAIPPQKNHYNTTTPSRPAGPTGIDGGGGVYPHTVISDESQTNTDGFARASDLELGSAAHHYGRR